MALWEVAGLGWNPLLYLLTAYSHDLPLMNYIPYSLFQTYILITAFAEKKVSNLKVWRKFAVGLEWHWPAFAVGSRVHFVRGLRN